MTNDIAALIERLKGRKEFWLNGSHWMMATEPDQDCQAAAAALTRMSEALEVAQEYIEYHHDYGTMSHPDFQKKYALDENFTGAQDRIYKLSREAADKIRDALSFSPTPPSTLSSTKKEER